MENPVSAISFFAKLGGWVTTFWNKPRLRVLPFDPAHNLAIWDLRGPVSRIQKVFTQEVRNGGRKTAHRCIALAEFWKAGADQTTGKLFVLHWADVDYSFRTTGTEPVDIGPEGRRLDVAFTFQGQTQPGCWVATPAALAAPALSGDHLPPGDYEVRLEIKADNASSVVARFRVSVGQNWNDLTVFPKEAG